MDPERLEAVIRILGEPVMVETSPGDVLFFHRLESAMLFVHVSLSSVTSSTRVGQIFPRTDDGILSWLTIREPKRSSKVFILNKFII